MPTPSGTDFPLILRSVVTTHDALGRVHYPARMEFEQEEFWSSIDRRAESEPEPPSSRSTCWAQSIHTILDKDVRVRFLEAANQRDTTHLDTHPALRDRLAAMGCHSPDSARTRQTHPAGLHHPTCLGDRQQRERLFAGIRDQPFHARRKRAQHREAHRQTGVPAALVYRSPGHCALQAIPQRHQAHET
jgi:hypothetical protein